jgi:hypothetical protein
VLPAASRRQALTRAIADGRRFASEIGADFVEVSSHSGEGVDALLATLVRACQDLAAAAPAKGYVASAHLELASAESYQKRHAFLSDSFTDGVFADIESSLRYVACCVHCCVPDGCEAVREADRACVPVMLLVNLIRIAYSIALFAVTAALATFVYLPSAIALLLLRTATTEHDSSAFVARGAVLDAEPLGRRCLRGLVMSLRGLPFLFLAVGLPLLTSLAFLDPAASEDRARAVIGAQLAAVLVLQASACRVPLLT